jgi:phosphatidyl-myo-inositol dimannoside synthase
MTHLLVTNDFPPKTGGIQSYLWELWRRLDPASYAVLTASSDPAAAAFDSRCFDEGIRIERSGTRFLLPTPSLARRIDAMAADIGADLVVLDPALPLGLLGRSLRVPYAVVLHGAEVTVPGRLPMSPSLLASVIRRAQLVICAGRYPASEARRVTRSPVENLVEVPPGVDAERFHPFSGEQRSNARAAFGLAPDGLVVSGVSRLVPRKGFDVVIGAVAALSTSFPDLSLVLAGEGRDRGRLERVARRESCPVRFLGRVDDDALPSLYGAADVFAMPCRDRWGGLEQEGFGIVFLEAAASGLPQVAGRSGGADEAVADGSTGLVVDDPADRAKVAAALRRLLTDRDLRKRMGVAARNRAEQLFGYDLLSRRLAGALASVEG